MSDDILKLAEGFKKASESEWHRLAEGGLKTRGLKDVLNQKSHSGFAYPVLATAAEMPDGHGSVGSRRSAEWDIRAEYPQDWSPERLNRAILRDLAGGVTSLSLGCAPDALDGALDGVHLDMIGVFLDGCDNLAATAAALKAVWVERGADRSVITGGFGAQPEPGSEAMEMSVALALEAAQDTPHIATFHVTAENSEAESGELAAVISRTIHYVDAMERAGLSLEQAFSQVRVRLEATEEQFLTIAKFRALRLLMARLGELLDLPEDGLPRIDARIAAGHDPAGKAAGRGGLEATVAALAAAVAGADTLIIPALTGPTRENPFSSNDDKRDERGNGRRLARNIHHLLAEESHLGFVDDPAAGSFAIERMTHDLARRAWQIWQSGDAHDFGRSTGREAAQ